MSRRSWVQSPVWSLFCTLTSDGADVSEAVCGLGEGFMIWGFLSDVIVGEGVYNEKKV